MPALLPDVDPDGLLEYSVVYTDRALNHMSRRFGAVMRDIDAILREAHGAEATAVVPGSGTFGMEAVARQLAGGRVCLVVRNGWFSYRWSQIFEMGRIPAREVVLQARPLGTGAQAAWVPPPLAEVVEAIGRERPALVFAPHVETASGLLLSDDYLRALADAVHAVGGLFVLDGIASGAVWVDMPGCGVDVLVSAPQKGWSGSPGCAFVLLSARARRAVEASASSSFACDLKKWLAMMDSYKAGAYGYHTTMPTDALARTRDAMAQTRAAGFALLRERQFELGRRVRALLEAAGLPSVAAPGWPAPGVVVSHTTHPGLASAQAFAAQGLQTAAGVPLQCGEGADWRTFRIGLFGLDKLLDVERTVGHLAAALPRALAEPAA
jgi:aspartate aminotransferase-like enzyme